MVVLTCQLKVLLCQQFLFVLIQKKCYTGMLCHPIKDVFLKSVTLKIITPLLHSSFHSSSSTDSINPSLSEEDDDDTESATIQKAAATMLTLKDWYGGLGFRDDAVGIFESDLLQKASVSSRWQFWCCSHHSIHRAIYTISVHLNCVCFGPCTHPTLPTQKLLCPPTSVVWLTTGNRAGCSTSSRETPNPRTGSSQEPVLSFCNQT